MMMQMTTDLFLEIELELSAEVSDLLSEAARREGIEEGAVIERMLFPARQPAD